MTESGLVNIAHHLPAAAVRNPDGLAIAAYDPSAPDGWHELSWSQLNRRADTIAAGLVAHGWARGDTTLVMVRAGVELISLTFALFKIGAVPVLIDPGMGMGAFFRCVKQCAPRAFIGIPLAHVIRVFVPGAFRSVVRHATVGRRWFCGGPTLASFQNTNEAFPVADTRGEDLAAVLFTSGSTGAAKGARYTHGMFAAQVEALGRRFQFREGEIDCAAFPLFSLFDVAFGMTSVIPPVDPARPASCDPLAVAEAVRKYRCTVATGSPAIWRRVGDACLAAGEKLPSLERVLMFGAPIPPSAHRTWHQVISSGGDVLTPYGATEALPVAVIGGREVLGTNTEPGTEALTRAGAGTCVGRPVDDITLRIITIRDEAIPNWSDELEEEAGVVGEIVVRGLMVTREYHELPEATALAKIRDSDGTIWHRMGDLGYLDEQGRLWFCGRKTERLRTAEGPLYTDKIEGRFAGYDGVGRVALVGVGPRGQERPVLFVEGPEDPEIARRIQDTALVAAVLFREKFPVDRRHNAKIHRMELKAEAEARLGGTLARTR